MRNEEIIVRVWDIFYVILFSIFRGFGWFLFDWNLIEHVTFELVLITCCAEGLEETRLIRSTRGVQLFGGRDELTTGYLRFEMKILDLENTLRAQISHDESRVFYESRRNISAGRIVRRVVIQ